MKGFTLIELLIVISITLVLAVAVIPVYGNLQVSAQLNESSAQIIQTLRIAKTQSAAGYNDSQHGVKFLANSYTLYQGTSYAARDAAYDREIILDSSLSLNTTLTDDDINFSKGIGSPNNNTVVITLAHSVAGTRLITINSFGMVEEN